MDSDTLSRPGAAIDTEIKYLVPTSRINRRFWAPGAEYNTGVYDFYPATIRNARLRETPPTLDEHGFCLAEHPTKVTDFADADTLKAIYPAEVEEVAKRLTGCDFIHPMGGQLRSPVVGAAGVQPPAAEAHVDFNTPTANAIAKVFYDQMRPDGPGYDRFLCFSLWRTFSPPPQDWPLALCEGPSIGEEDSISNYKVDVDEIPTGADLFAPIPDEEKLLAATIFKYSPGHRWWYYPDMTRDEVIFIKFHDSDHSRAWRSPHTAFHDTTRPDANVRRSYEFRAIAYFEKKG